jgi:UDP-N-acetylmuramate dehydrogenase
MIKTKSTLIQSDVPISELTTIATSGVVRSLAAPKNTEELINILKQAKDENVSYHILGKGSNVIIKENNDSLFICTSEIKSHKINNHELTADAGSNLSAIINLTTSRNLSGLETLWGIPATIGGACYMNAGGRFGEIFDHLLWVEIIDQQLQIVRLSKKDLKYGYRNGGVAKGAVVVQSCFQLTEENPKHLKERLGDVKRYKISTQPLKEKSSGCIFKNPKGATAAGLIEQAGLKGTRVNDAVVSSHHSNFIINEGNATASDLLKLMDIIKKTVRHKFSVDLELEVEILQ